MVNDVVGVRDTDTHQHKGKGNLRLCHSATFAAPIHGLPYLRISISTRSCGWISDPAPRGLDWTESVVLRASAADVRYVSGYGGDAYGFAHGLFECWLHRSWYHTQSCKNNTTCRRRICFFPYTPEQLRVLQQQTPRSGSTLIDLYDGSPLRRQAALEDFLPKSLKSSSRTSMLITPPVSPPSESPSASPSGGALHHKTWPVARSAMNVVLSSLRQLQLTKAKLLPCASLGFGTVY